MSYQCDFGPTIKRNYTYASHPKIGVPVVIYAKNDAKEKEEEKEEEKKEEEEKEQDGDDVRRSPWLNLVTGASGGASAQEYWDCDFRTLL